MPPVHSAARASVRRLLAVFALSLAVLIVEIVGGIAANSLAVLADAGHVFTDVAGIGLALLAIWIAARPAGDDRTFGYLRLEVLAAVVNAVLLLVVAAVILVEAWRRLAEPPAVTPSIMVVVAVLGLAANAASIAILQPTQGHSLTVRGAYLEVLGDFAASVAVIVAAIVVATTGWTAADPLASALIAFLILPRTWALLRDAVDVLLEASPKGVALADVRTHILEAPGVADVHDLHAWTITSGMNVVSAHVVVEPDADRAAVLDHLCECLSADFDIEHSTFQLETSDRRRIEAAAHG